MATRQDRPTRPADRTDETSTADDQHRDSAAQAADASAKADTFVDDIDDLLDECDRLLLERLGFKPGEVVDPAEVERRAEIANREYEQKGGQ